jgi:hypothetical protein
MPEAKCIVDNFGGIQHPYRYCIKSLEDMIDYDKINRLSGEDNLVGVTEAAAGLTNYASSLVSDPRNAIREKCNGFLGNKYILKSGLQCKNMDENVHIYVNNIASYNYLTARREENMGIIPAAINSAFEINGGNLVSALFEDPKQDCIKTNLKCHVVEENKSTNTRSEKVPISVRQYDELVEKGEISPTDDERAQREDIGTESYTNLHESIHNYLDNNSYLLPSKNLEVIQDNSDHGDVLFNLYYLFLSGFLLFLVFKIIHKK